MPVPTDIDDLSQTPAGNDPQGGEAVFPTLDNHLRQIYAFIAMLRDGDGFVAGAIGPEDISAIGDGSVSTNKIVDVNVTYAKLAIAVREMLASTGDVKLCAYTSAPNGWLECNGDAVSRVDYAALFSAIGTTFGAGDGSTTFNIPDLRGEFVRGWDNGRGVDTGRVFGSSQSSANLAHTHTASTASGGSHSHDAGVRTEGTTSHVYDTNTVASGGRLDTTDGTSTTSPETETAGSHTHTVTVNSSGGTEARPRNIALMYVIKT
jgi:microcystin-dependent protein